jgi:hypothetical protein
LEHYRTSQAPSQSFDAVFEPLTQADCSPPIRQLSYESVLDSPPLNPVTNLGAHPSPPPGLSDQSPLKQRQTQEFWDSQNNGTNGHSRLGSGLEEVQNPNGKTVLRSNRSSPTITRTNTVAERSSISRREPRRKTSLTAGKLTDQLRRIADNSKKLCHLNHFFRPHRVYYSLTMLTFGNTAVA